MNKSDCGRGCCGPGELLQDPDGPGGDESLGVPATTAGDDAGSIRCFGAVIASAAGNLHKARTRFRLI